MKHRVITSTIVAVSVGLAGAPVFAQFSPETVSPLEKQQPAAVVGKTLDLEPRERLAELRGMTVKDTKGQEIGDISKLVEGVRDQQPYAMLSVGGFLGMGETEVAIPLRQLQRVGEHLELISGVTRDQLKEQTEASQFYSENYRDIDFGARN